jgi:hypothetical protein
MAEAIEAKGIGDGGSDPAARQEHPLAKRQPAKIKAKRCKPTGTILRSFENSELGYGFLIGNSWFGLSAG